MKFAAKVLFPISEDRLANVPHVKDSLVIHQP